MGEITEKNSVLIVDDEKLNLEVLSHLLMPEYAIYTAKNGKDAIEKTNEYLPDLILLDIIMPDMNGYEILSVLKKSEKTQNIPVIFITGLDSVENEEKALELDAADFIRKPFHSASVKLRVQNQLKIVNQIRSIKQYAHDLQMTLTKLEAINNNYKGIIWSVDANGNITSFSGEYLKNFEFKKDFNIIGKNMEFARKIHMYSDIIDYVEKTFKEGPQDWMNKINGRNFHSHTMPMYDEYGNIVGVVGSSDDVTNIVELHAAVAAAREKSLFFAKMSHEMRTPLNTVIGLTNVILDEGGLAEEVMENIEKVLTSGESLLALVNDILDISKMEGGKFELVNGEYEISNMINDAVTQSIVYKGDKPVGFVLNIDKNIPARLFGDDMRIKQVLINLLSNAFKYTKSGTVELMVRAEPLKDQNIILNLAVKDTGIGIKQEDINKLFADYSQMDTNSNKHIEGTGLGLSITKTITSMMDGKISVESEFGKGSTFLVGFPQKKVGDGLLGEDTAARLKNLNYHVKKHSVKSQLPRIVMPYAHVLVVDDTVANLDVARAMMKSYKMQIDCVTRGEDAVNLVREEKVKYSAIFMDQMMPGMDGLEAARIIREEIGTDYAKTVPMIGFTANAIAGNKELFLSHGFQAFLTKPVDIKALDSVLREWVHDEELERKYIEQQMTSDNRSGGERRSGRDRRKKYNRRVFNEGIKGVNFEKGLERFFGDKDTFVEILQSFASNTKILINTMKEVNNETLPQYAIDVHGIKSSCRGISAEEAGNMAEALEKAAKSGDLDFVTANNTEFVGKIFQLIENIEIFLGKLFVEKVNKLKKQKPYKEVLLNLKAACENYQIEEIEIAIKEMDCFEYTADDGLAAWLLENVHQMNYMDVVEKLSELD